MEPKEASAEKDYKHWKKVLENYITACGEDAPDKLQCLTRYVSSSIYEHIADAATYNAAVRILDQLTVYST